MGGMVGIKPFQYGFDILNIYDSGSVLAPAILDITPEDIRAKFCEGVANVAAVSLNIGYPTIASVPHSIANGFRNIMACAAPVEEAAAEEEAAPAAVESEEESDDDMGFD